MDITEPRPRIEIASEDDAEQVIEFMKLYGNYFQGEEEWLSRSTIVVARQGDRIVGTRCLHRVTDDYYHVYGLCVHPEFRGKGLSTDLWDYSDKYMYEQGARGYLGEAQNEKLAQYYVRKRGVKICRLSLRGWRNDIVPVKKKFRQEGFTDSALKLAHDSAVWLMQKKSLEPLSVLLESISSRIKPY